MHFKKLPCGVYIDLDKNECCLTSCFYEKIRNCDTKDKNNSIELCYAWYQNKCKGDDPVLKYRV
jgi:hypothetical protein